jgi:hypothetical protein
MKLHVCVFSDSSLEWTVLATPFILNQWLRSKMCKHCKKRLGVFLSPAGMSLTKLSLARNNKIVPARESLVIDFPAGDRKIANFFLQCTGEN